MTSLRDAVNRVLAGGIPAAPPAASEHRISWETVESVTERNECVVLGHTLPVTGLAAFPVGARVPVAWRNGAPVAVIGHRTRRAQFHPSRRRTAQGIVEELLVGNFDSTSPGIWYRTHDRLEPITTTDGTPLRTFPNGATPVDVKWGLDGKSFAVQCSTGLYAVYVLERDDPNVVDPASPGLATLSWSDRPLENTTSLVSVTFTHRVKRTFRYWIGKFFTTIAYRAVQSAWFDGGMWVWSEYWANWAQGWETTTSGEGSAAVSSTKEFPLKEVLSGGIVDWYGHPLCRGTVSEWFLDADLHVKFLVQVDWDYFWVGTNATGTGSIHFPFGGGPYGMDGYDEQIRVGGTSLGCIGAKRQSDQQTVPETHLFLWDGTAKAVAWSTASRVPLLGNEQIGFTYRILEHHKRTDPGYSESGLPDPHMPGWTKPPSEIESYYGGANWSNLPLTNYPMNDLGCGDERGTILSNTGTYQLFDPSKLSCITGPFVSLSGDTFSRVATMLGGYTANYVVNFSTRTGTTQRLWHYRVAWAQLFFRRYAADGTTERDSGMDEPLLFLVLERYPFIGGTGYINDLPMTWVGIVTPAGAIVATLRDWEHGLSAAACRLLTGNGHRLFWTCGVGAIQPTVRYVYTDLDALAETVLTQEQALQLLTSRRQLLTPDWCWERLGPQGFYALEALPVLEPDEIMAEYGALLGAEGGPEGSVRVINDPEILDALDRYRAR